MELDDNIEKLNNVGIKRADKLKQLGIFKINDIVEYFPRDYIDRTDISNIESLIVEKENTFIASVASIAENICINNKLITKIKFKDITGTITAIWYNQPYLKNNFSLGTKYILTGKVSKNYNKLEINSPEYEKFENKEVLSAGRIVPVYSSTYKLSQKMLRQLIKSAIDNTFDKLTEFLPASLTQEYKLMQRNQAVKNIHFPSDKEHFIIARYRLVFEELFLLQLGLMRIKLLNSDNKQSIIINEVNEEKLLIKSLPFELTNSQKNAILEIKNNMSNGIVMNRLIQGDVGSGKTIVALIASFTAAKNGYQSALMVPTEVLATQHFESFSNYLLSFGIKVALLTGSTNKKQKQTIIEQLESGQIDIVIGTHALIQENIIFKSLALVITDEQHRFGVKQRSILSNKGLNPHILVMTATPIPRTLALILYGDLDITTINELPPNRQKIDTFAVDTSYHKRIYEFIKKELYKGRQSYIICPMVEEDEKFKDLKSVKLYAQYLKEDVFTNYSVEYIYGQMKSNNKQEIMDKFLKKEIDILISTTVIEVGINVPNATIIVIENAERFGLAQLHQLRGRVGRGNYKSYCILVTDSKNKVAAQRMKIMCKSNNGFELSEVDLDLRGPGDFFGTRQHGLPEMKIANLYKDTNILKDAQKAASEILNKDFKLEASENKLLNERLQKFFNQESTNISL